MTSPKKSPSPISLYSPCPFNCNTCRFSASFYSNKFKRENHIYKSKPKSKTKLHFISKQKIRISDLESSNPVCMQFFKLRILHSHGTPIWMRNTLYKNAGSNTYVHSNLHPSTHQDQPPHWQKPTPVPSLEQAFPVSPVYVLIRHHKINHKHYIASFSNLMLCFHINL